MDALDAGGQRGEIIWMTARACSLVAILMCLFVLSDCRDRNDQRSESSRKSLPPVFPQAPASNTNWDGAAGPVMLLSIGDATDSAAVVLPEATDSTLDSLSTAPDLRGRVFDLFGRGGSVGSSTAVLLATSPRSQSECISWPIARLTSGSSGWRVGFVHGDVRALALDSIESLSSSDSAALAASLTKSAATLPVSSDPTFSKLPFRIRSAYTFKLDSTQAVIADVVRALNEEASPRIEHLFLVGERAAGTREPFRIGYYSRVAGAEETIQATEVLAVVEVGTTKRPAIVIGVESDEGVQLGLIEKNAPGLWRLAWTSANTDCEEPE